MWRSSEQCAAADVESRNNARKRARRNGAGEEGGWKGVAQMRPPEEATRKKGLFIKDTHGASRDMLLILFFSLAMFSSHHAAPVYL